MGWKKVVVALAPKRLIAPLIARRTWTYRTAGADDDHLSRYWESSTVPRREQLIAVLVRAVRDATTPLSVLEFGSHVGVNLRLLGEEFGPASELFAVEPNFEAVEFLRIKLPHVCTLRADHRGYLRADGVPGRHITLSFANAVFYSMSPRATRRVMRKMLATSDVVVVGDNLENADGRRSAFDADHHSFRHPFAAWIRQTGGFDVSTVDLESDGDYALSGFLVARRVDRTPVAPG